MCVPINLAKSRRRGLTAQKARQDLSLCDLGQSFGADPHGDVNSGEDTIRFRLLPVGFQPWANELLFFARVVHSPGGNLQHPACRVRSLLEIAYTM